jgi:hypothetical protein
LWSGSDNDAVAMNDPRLIPLRDAVVSHFKNEGGPCQAVFIVDGKHLQVSINEVDSSGSESSIKWITGACYGNVLGEGFDSPKLE